jgi:hypothetical protein
MARSSPVEPVQVGDSGDEEIDAFLRDAQRGWILNPALAALYAHVPEGLRGWRRMVEGIVEEIGPLTWELIAHRTAVVTGNVYETTCSDEAVRKQVEALRPAVCEPALDAAALGKRLYLAAALADEIARHEVSPELFQDVKDEYGTSEVVGLCMAASLAHVSQLVSDVLGVSPEAAS